MADDNKITYFLAGLGVGALVGLLFAPRTGEETRRLIGEKATEGRDYMTRKSRDLADQAGEYISKGKEAAGEYAAKGKEAVARQKENLRSAIEVGKQAYRDASERGAGS